MTMYSGDRAAQSDRRARQGRLRLFFELTRGQATPPGEHSDESDHRVRGFRTGLFGGRAAADAGWLGPRLLTSFCSWS